MTEDFEQPTLWTGCLGQIVVGWLLTAVTLVIAAAIGLMFASWWWFLGSAIGLSILLDLFDRWSGRKERNRRLRKRFWGLPED